MFQIILPNLHKSTPIHSVSGVWGELVKDVSAVRVLEHIEEARDSPNRIPDQTGHLITGGIVMWWSPKIHGFAKG